jgi:hypothetical protein
VPEEISHYEEMRRGLVNTQRRLRDLEEREVEHEHRKQQRRAVQVAGNEP